MLAQGRCNEFTPSYVTELTSSLNLSLQLSVRTEVALEDSPGEVQ
jgi:hypothetical protein